MSWKADGVRIHEAKAISLQRVQREKRKVCDSCKKCCTPAERLPKQGIWSTDQLMVTSHYCPHANGKARNSFIRAFYIHPSSSLYVSWQRELNCSCLKCLKHLDEGKANFMGTPQPLLRYRWIHSHPNRRSSGVQPNLLCRHRGTKPIARCHNQRGQMLIQHFILNDSSSYAFNAN